MKYAHIAKLRAEQFRRLTGVKRETFQKMVNILIQEARRTKNHRSRPSKVPIEDKLLMCLEYLREYRTYFHVSQSYGVSESYVYKICRWVENTLIKHPDFSLPGRKALLKNDKEWEIIRVDATETPIERPKKSRNAIILEKRNATR